MIQIQAQRHLLASFAPILFTLLALNGAQAAESSKSAPAWDTWYTVTCDSKPCEYYREKISVEKDGKLHFLNYVWKKEGEFINQEQLGALAENDDDASPLFYNFHSVYRSTETNIDGNVRDGKLTVKVKKSQTKDDATLISKIMPKGAFFSVFFPIWVGKHLDALKEGQSKSYSTLLEDNVDLGFTTVPGTIRLEKSDDFAKNTKTRKLAVEVSGLRTTWWVDSKGMAVKIEEPEQKMTIEKTTQAKAESSLN
jgi:hypothetical protein